MSTGDFDIKQTRDGSWIRLSLSGDLDFTSAQTLEARLEGLRAEGNPVKLDLSEIEFLDSSGLMLLSRAIRKAREAGWTLEIERDVSAMVARRLDIAGLRRLLNEPSQDAPDPGDLD
jgi:anti-anti-sigma factor